jgi:hypothetical protein
MAVNDDEFMIPGVAEEGLANPADQPTNGTIPEGYRATSALMRW